jgi:hypothetical protein
MNWHQVLLEYLRILLQWPPIAGLVAVVFLTTYRHQVRALLSGATKIRLPGGSEVTITQAERKETALLPASPATGLPEAPVPALPQSIQLSPAELKEIENVLRAYRAEAYLWEYRYLNFFLVRHTKEALDWLAGVPQPSTVRAFEAFWIDRIADPTERAAVLAALGNHHLVDRTDDIIRITEKGREYIRWRGPLLPAAAA